jgi:ribosomal protein S18 acetylase RimI-like enzyme
MSETVVHLFRSADSQPSDPLENVIWNALTTRHRDLAHGGALARRYPSEIASFAALPAQTDEGYAELRELIPEGGVMAFFTVDPIAPPPGMFNIVLNSTAEQMVASTLPAPRGHLDPVALTESDVPEMLELVALTKPGPFGPRTIELGGYLGIRGEGKLVAMVGERMKVEGFTEVSAVCVHPEWRGRGLANELILLVAENIARRGETPFLHVFSDNEPAIALYEKLGFERLRTVHVTALGVPA